MSDDIVFESKISLDHNPGLPLLHFWLPKLDHARLTKQGGEPCGNSPRTSHLLSNSRYLSDYKGLRPLSTDTLDLYKDHRRHKADSLRHEIGLKHLDWTIENSQSKNQVLRDLGTKENNLNECQT